MFLSILRTISLTYIVYVFLIFTLKYVYGVKHLPNLTPVNSLPKTTYNDTNAIPRLLNNYDASVTCVNVSSNFQRSGDVNIGGLFNIRAFRDGECQDEDIDPTNLQMMYAMLYMIDKINADEDILTNVTLGFNIRDYCGDVNLAVRSSMDFIKKPASDCSNTDILDGFGVNAVVGPMHSDAALSVASLFSLFKLPVISPFATSTDLSDQRYSYFLRNVPSDDIQIITLADIVQYFGWSSIGVLSTDDIGYGIKGSELLIDELQTRNICVAYQTRFNVEFTDSEFDDIIDHLRNLSNIKVLVAISNEVSMLRLLDAFHRNKMYGYTWLASEGWAWSPMLVKDRYYKVVQGMLGVTVPSYRDLDFKKYLQELKPNCQDPFLTRYWEHTHNCYLTTRSIKTYNSACTGNETFPSGDPFLAETLVSAVIDAVKVIAYGLQACNSSEPEQLLKCMKNVSFVNEKHSRIVFKENGDLASYGRYDITNIQPGSDCLPYLPPKLVGTWTENGGLDIDESAIYWPTPDGSCDKNWKESIDGVVPKSFCSPDCDFGSRQQTVWENNCCWKCIPCEVTEYTNTTNALACITCNYDEVANLSQNGCDKLAEYYLTPRDNSFALILGTIGLIGIAATFILLIFFVVKRYATVVYHSCGNIFKFPLLICIICCFSFSSFFLSSTTSLSCRISATIHLLPIVLCQTILLCTCVVHKFDSKHAKRYSTWIFIILIISYTCFIAIGYVANTPGLEKHPDYLKKVLIVGCAIKSELSCYLLALAYILLLNIVGIILSNKIRTTEGNFNEAKFIFYTFISNTMLWTAIVLVHFLVGKDIHSKHLIVAFEMISSGYIFLACIFFPKLNAYKHKLEARALVECTKQKRGWKFRRKVKEANPNWNKIIILADEALITKQNIVTNINKTMSIIKEDTMQANRMISLYKERQRELRNRHSPSESELLNKIHILQNVKEQIASSSKCVKTTRC